MARPFPFNTKALRRASKLPIIGPWIGRVGRVAAIFSNPCAPRPEIWIIAAFYATPVFFWTLFNPTPTDQVAERFGRKTKKFKFTFQDFDFLPIVPKNEVSVSLLSGLSLLRHIGWYFTVADAVTGAGVNWTSMAYRWSGCQVDHGAWAQAHILPDSVELLPAGDYLVETWIVDGHFGGMFNDSASIACASNLTPSIGFSLSSKHNDFGLPDASWSARLVHGLTGATVAQGSGVDHGGGVSDSRGFYANGISIFNEVNKLNAGGSYFVVVTKGFGVIQWASGTFSGNASPLSDAITSSGFIHHGPNG